MGNDGLENLRSRFGITGRHLIEIALLFAFLSAACGSALAGDVLKFSGVITDPSGAAIPQAQVVIHNLDTGTEQSTSTDSQGWYEFLAAPGQYKIEVTAQGFKTYVHNGLELGPTAPLRIDAGLQVASKEEEVIVSLDNAQIDTSNTQVGEAISQKKMTSVPLNGRSYTDLLNLQAGVVPASSAQSNAVVMSGCTSTPPSGDLNPGNMSVSGQRETSNGFFVNGSSVEEAFNNTASVVPNLDSIAEFRVLTSSFDAEYGNFSGGQVLVVTKTGTNNLHGSAFGFFRDTHLDSRNYLASERARYDRRQYGGTLGGPALKNKVFFFADYQGTDMTQGVETGLISVPSLQNRQGDFSDIARQLTGTVSGPYLANLLSNRLQQKVTAGEPYYTASCTNTSDCVFPDAKIPSTAWSAPAKALLKYIPAPNVGSNTFSTSAQNQTLGDNKAALHLDWNNSLGTFSAYYFRDGYRLDNPYPSSQGGANVPGFNALSTGRAQLLNLGWTKPWGSNTVNELHFSYIRNSNKIGQPIGGLGVSLAEQGFISGTGTLGIVPLNPAAEGVENVSFNDFTIGVDVTGEKQTNDTYQWTDNLSRVIGKNTLKFGVDFHLDQVNIDSNSINNGAFVFQGTETGLDFADYLIGTASNYEQGDANPFYLRNKYIGLYAQNSWQALRNLTLNYGVRWEVLPPWHEKYNQIQTFVLGQQSEVYPGAPEGLVFPGDTGIPNTLAQTKWNNFSPRVGLAYSPSTENRFLKLLFGDQNKSSIRGSFGIFHTAFEGLSAGIMSACPPYGYDYDSTGGRPLFEQPFVSASTGKSNGQPFPSPIPTYGASRKSPNTTVDWSKYNPITGDPAFYYKNVSPYTESYTLSVERELVANTFLKVSYVGTQSHRLLVLTPASPGNAEYCKSVSTTSQVEEGTATCGPFSEGGLFHKADGSEVQVRGPFGSSFDGITYQKTMGSSNYNALELSLRRSGGALEFLAAYTYSKSLDNSSSLSEEVNPIDPQLSRAISAFDIRHNLVVSYDYHLPVQALTHRNNAWARGWELSGISRFASGLPVTLYNNDDTSLLGSIPNGINNNGVDTPDYTQGDLKLNRNPRTSRFAFNTSLFSIPQSMAEYGHMGTARRRFFSGPGLENFDMAVEKQINLTESKSLELRLESFNTFNHAQFFSPEAVNGNPDSNNFGMIVNANAPRQMQVAAKFKF